MKGMKVLTKKEEHEVVKQKLEQPAERRQTVRQRWTKILSQK